MRGRTLLHKACTTVLILLHLNSTSYRRQESFSLGNKQIFHHHGRPVGELSARNIVLIVACVQANDSVAHKNVDITQALFTHWLSDLVQGISGDGNEMRVVDVVGMNAISVYVEVCNEYLCAA